MPRQLLGTAIAANTITTTQLQTTVVNQISAGGGPRVSSLIYPGNDTAGNTVGGQTVYINGSGFETNNAIYINGNAVPSKSFISASNLSFTTPALSAGIYPVYVINTDSGATAIFVPGYISSAEPAWATAAGSLSESQDELSAWSYSLSATGDAPITYALAAGSSLPTGVSLAANGLISGTITSPSGNVTTYTFSVVATDAQNQDSTRQFTVTTSTGEGVLFANNVLLIHADGTNNQNNHTFLDSSNNNFTITRNGNATQGSFSPFSQTGWSGYFDGTGDYLSAASNTAFDFGTGEFTIEAWVYRAQTAAAQTIVDARNVDVLGPYILNIQANNKLDFIYSTSARLMSSGTVANNSWNHVAVSRAAGVLRLFINGNENGNVSTSASITGNAATALWIGSGRADGSGNPGYYMNGYISNLRIIKGTGLYTSNFTPSTAALTAVANTSLLISQSNRFVDNSNNNFTLTRYGDVSVQAFSPFAPTAAYSTAAVGGSGYFDGTGDYLALANNAAFGFGSGDFTMECWFYKTTTNLDVLIDTRVGATSATGMALYVQSNTLKAGNDGERLSGGTVVSNSWNHCAVVRSGNNLYLYLNGTRTANAAFSTTLAVSSSPYIGNSGSGEYAGGYLASVRILKGTAQYTGSTYTVPTAPLTNIANTSLLCNFTNAGIFDQTAKNILETVGDAKVSTAQYKYGTGSIYIPTTSDAVKMTGVDLQGDFTIEGWVKPSIAGGEKFFILQGINQTNGFLIGLTTAEIRWRSNGQTDISAAISKADWYHFAISRSGSGSNNVKVFVDGTQVTQGTYTNTILASAGNLNIGSGGLLSASFASYGYIDDLRITKGYARYTTNFTPPTSALKDK